MKKSLLLFIAYGMMVSAMAQFNSHRNDPKSHLKVPAPTYQIDDQVVGVQAPNGTVASDATLADEIVIQSVYDSANECCHAAQNLSL